MDQQLQVFITVVELKNFSRAAEALHMTQPAVSQYIRILEENIGVKLLERTSKYVRVNKAGKIVYHHAKEITGLYTRMNQLVDDLVHEVSGSLSIGSSYTFGEYVLPKIISEMKELYPTIHPNIRIGNTTLIAELVKNHQLDIGIVEGHFKDEKLFNVEHFSKDTMVIIASPKDKISIEKLASYPWILRENGSGTREAGEKAFKQLGINPANKMNFGSIQLIKESVAAGLGISILSTRSIQKELKNGDLQIIETPGSQFTRDFSFITATPFRTKSLQAFIDLLREENKHPLT